MKKSSYALIVILAIVVDGDGAIIQTYDGSKLEGTIQSIKQGEITIAPKKSDEATQSIALFDVGRITFPAPADEALARKLSAKSWRINLLGDNRLTAEVQSWSDGRVRINVLQNADRTQSLAIPTRHIREMWAEPKENEKAGEKAWEKAREKAREMAPTSDTLDVVYVKAKDPKGELKAVQGRCLGLGEDSLRFEFESELRTIALDRVVGVVLARQGRAVELKSFHQILELHRGDRIAAEIIELEADHVLRLKTPWNAELRLPLDWVANVTIRHGRRTYLSDLVPVFVEEIPYFDRMMHFRVDESLANGPIRLKDGEYKKGISVHSRCVLYYDLAGAYESFRSKVGFQQPTGAQGRALVRVKADDRVLFEQPDVRGEKDPVALDLKLAGVKTLILEVGFGENQDVGDRVVWADAQLIRSDSAR